MIPLIVELAAARREAGLRQQDIAAELGLSPTAGPKMVSAWEFGRSVPTVGHVCGYARAVGRRVVAVRDGQTVGELLELMPRLADVIADAGLTISALAAGLFIAPETVHSTLRTAGPRTRLTTALSILGAVRCRIGLAPAEQAVTA